MVLKHAFGGIGKNWLNPALSAALFLWFAFPDKMNYFVASGTKPSPFAIEIDTLASSATPLIGLKESGSSGFEMVDMFIGNTAGCIGEVSVLLVFAGGLYLFLRRIISWQIPLGFLVAAAVLAYLVSPVEGKGTFIAENLFSGGIMLGAVIMANDYSTSPMTKSGRFIYGAFCGALTIFIRRYTSFVEGVALAILFMNLLSRPIDNLLLSGAFAKKRKIPLKTTGIPLVISEETEKQSPAAVKEDKEGNSDTKEEKH